MKFKINLKSLKQKQNNKSMTKVGQGLPSVLKDIQG